MAGWLGILCFGLITRWPEGYLGIRGDVLGPVIVETWRMNESSHPKFDIEST